ncbi:MAG: 4-hydroxy-3-methylbut-2-enyl diphosphate reductase [Firmicutes bacterium]|nr:4-hydroxy-3-methylbut-2-enyl diphosphate reductase [Bacillota bacterium]
MKVIRITPRGFCPGVVRAISLVNNAIQNPNLPRPIYILGMIVHNKQVVNDFTSKGVITLDEPNRSKLDLLKQVQTGTIIITAHGTSEDVLKEIKSKGLTLVDATCKDVYKTHDLIRQYLAKNYQILYIGKKHHPETVGVLGIDSSIISIEKTEDIDLLQLDSKLIFVTNQTTLSVFDFEEIKQKLIDKFPFAFISEEICDSTRIRQEAIVETNKNVDLCFIVGDLRSNNSKNLARVSETITNTKTILIETAHDIYHKLLKNDMIISVSSGASTPTETTSQVINYLEQFDEFNPLTWKIKN